MAVSNGGQGRGCREIGCPGRASQRPTGHERDDCTGRRIAGPNSEDTRDEPRAGLAADAELAMPARAGGDRADGACAHRPSAHRVLTRRAPGRRRAGHASGRRRRRWRRRHAHARGRARLPRARSGRDRFAALDGAELGHGRAVSWVAASAEVRGWRWLGPAELRDGGGWRLQREDGARHLPDLGLVYSGHRVAVEVELHAKAPIRLRAILRGYRALIDVGSVSAVTYVTDRPDVRALVERQAQAAGLGGVLQVGSLAQVVARTRQGRDR